MYKKLFFLYSLLLATSLKIYNENIQITAEDGTEIIVPDFMTTDEFLKKCRQDHHCYSGHLALDINDKLIKERSSDSQRDLGYHARNLFFNNANKATVVSLHYPKKEKGFLDYTIEAIHTLNSINNSYQQKNKNFNQGIEIEAPNNKIITVNPHETPAYFFRLCRNLGDCRSPEKIKLIINGMIIEENSSLANRPLREFSNGTNFAQARYR